MTPIPLTSPTGALYGYACGLCHHVRAGGETLGYPDGPVPMLVAASLREATECCRCPTCGAQETLEGLCPTCPAIEMTAAEFMESLDALRADPFRVAIQGVLAELAAYAKDGASFASWGEVFDAIDGWHKQIEEAMMNEWAR